MVMEEFDFSSPSAVIIGFFALFMSGLIVMIRIVQGFVFGGIIGGGLMGLVIGVAWFKIFMEK